MIMNKENTLSHNSSTAKLTPRVANPMVQPSLPAMPCASTVHGLTPAPLVISKDSPIPNKIRPKMR